MKIYRTISNKALEILDKSVTKIKIKDKKI